MRQQVSSIILLALMTGCGPLLCISVHEPDPYTKEVTQNIQAGVTTRQGVSEILGSPQVQRESGSIWIYGESRLAADCVSTTTHFHQSLLLQFEGEYVASYEKRNGKYGCITDELCLEAGWQELKHYNSRDAYKLASDYTVLTSRRSDDYTAKLFEAVDKRCSIYIYQKPFTSNMSYASPSLISLDRSSIFAVGGMGFLLLQRDPGTHSIKVGDVEHDFNCNGDDIVFIKIHKFHLPFGNVSYTINEIAETQGETAILSRHLILM